MGIGMRELIVILLVVLVVFGTKKLTTIGSDLGNAVRGFKKAMSDSENDESSNTASPPRQIRSEGTDAEFPESKTREAAQSTQKSDRPA